MLNIDKFDHIGVRVSDPAASVAFYETLGFAMTADGGFESGHPIVMLHPSGLNINLLGPGRPLGGRNVLMDEPDKMPGITHIAVKVADAAETEAFITAAGIDITERREFRGTSTIFIRDPDGTVLELVGPGPSVATLIAEHVSEG